MNKLARRLTILSAGVAVLACEGMTGRGAGAFESIMSDADRAECLSQGGTVVRNQTKADPKQPYCSTPAQDQACNEKMPVEYDSSGKRITYNYLYKSQTCEKNCFLTTACVGLIGLPDDCFELTALRRFRDDALAHMAGGAGDIGLYYWHAPEIVARIAGSRNAGAELARLYARYILPSAIASRLGFQRLTRRIYSGMMRELAARYGVTLA